MVCHVCKTNASYSKSNCDFCPQQPCWTLPLKCLFTLERSTTFEAHIHSTSHTEECKQIVTNCNSVTKSQYWCLCQCILGISGILSAPLVIKFQMMSLYLRLKVVRANTICTWRMNLEETWLKKLINNNNQNLKMRQDDLFAIQY